MGRTHPHQRLRSRWEMVRSSAGDRRGSRRRARRASILFSGLGAAHDSRDATAMAIRHDHISLFPIEPPCQWGSPPQLLPRTSRSYAGAPLREFARCSAIFAAVDLTNTSESSAQMCRNGATLGTKPWIAEFGLPAPSRIHVALDLYVFDTPHWTLCGS